MHLLVAAIALALVPASPAGAVLVEATATGGFGAPSMAGATALVPGIVLGAAGSVRLIASGEIEVAPGVTSDPNGFAAPVDGVFVTETTFAPLEEWSVDSGSLVLPRSGPVLDVGALMAVFVPASRAGDPAFEPFDEDQVELGVSPVLLFRVGARPNDVFLPGPGTLFLGINDWHAADNAGLYRVRVLVPEPGGLALAALGAAALLAAARPRSRA